MCQMLSIAQFAAKIGKSRQRVHQLMREGRISPAPVLVGSYYMVSEKARLTTVKNGRKVLP